MPKLRRALLAGPLKYPDVQRPGIARTEPAMAIARFPSIVIDRPDPSALTRFYGAMLDWKVDVSSDWG
jgi:hypothetical protein